MEEQQAAQQAEQSIAQDQAKGLAQVPAPVMDTMEAASGGIIAFANEGEVEYDPNKVYGDPYQVLSDAEAIRREEGRRKVLGIGEAVAPEYRQYLEKQRTDMPMLKERATGWDIADIFSNMYKSALERPGQGLVGQLTSGAATASPNIRARQQELAGKEKDIATMAQELYGKERTDKLGILTGIEKNQDEVRKAIGERERAKLSHSQRTTDLMQVFGVELAALGKEGKDVNDPAVRKTAMDRAQLIFGGKGAAQETKDLTAFTNAKDKDEKIGVKGTLTRQLNLLKLQTPPKDPEKLAKYNKSVDDLENEIAQRELVLERRYLKKQSGGATKVINLDNQN